MRINKKIPIKLDIIRFFIILLMNIIVVPKVFSVLYPLNAKERLVGKNITITVPQNNKKPLEYFAKKFEIGLASMLEANHGVDPYLPTSGSVIVIPQQLILPDTLKKGIIINNAEMRLYFYPHNSRSVIVLPIGIGELGRDTPNNWITKIQRKKKFPTWTPTQRIKKEYAERGEYLPTVVPAGPDNPMGLYALYIGNLYAIHGTNADFGIGLRVSHGCVRLRDDNIKWLFNNVPVGTRVQFINEPVKATVEPDGSRYIEVHNPLSITTEQLESNILAPIVLTESVKKILLDPSVNMKIVKKAISERSGIPVKIN